MIMVTCHICGRKISDSFYSVKANSKFYPEGVTIRIHLNRSCLRHWTESALVRQKAKLEAEKDEEQRRAWLAELSHTA